MPVGEFLGVKWLDHETGLCCTQLESTGRFYLWWGRQPKAMHLEMLTTKFTSLVHAADLAESLAQPVIAEWLRRLAAIHPPLNSQ